MRTAIMSSVLVSSLLVAACGARENDEPLTRDEAEQAVASVNLSGSAQALTYDVVEISTNFTLGEGVAKAAAQLKLFASSQIPCASVSAERGKVTIDFGDLEDACTFRGRNYGGVVVLELERSDGEALVHHSFQGLTNGKVTLDGDAEVTWSKGERARHVVYDITFRHADHDATFTSTGDVTQKLVDPALGLAGGVEIDGERAIERDGERAWLLEIDGVQVRGIDPVPQSGTYTLTTPKDKRVTLSFERLSETTIRVTLTGPKGRTRQVDVLSIE